MAVETSCLVSALTSSKRVDRPYYEVTIPNEMQQFDLLYIPSDTFYGNKYKYILSGIDVASKYKVARPLRTKRVKDVAEMIANILKVGPLPYSKIFQCDNDSEFKREVMCIRHVTSKYKHNHTAFVEALNKLLADKSFKVQDAQELNDPEKVSLTWVKHLHGLVNKLNNTETQVIGMSPKDAIKLKEVNFVESYLPEDTLPEVGLYHYLLQPSEEHDNQHNRAMDRIWS